MTRFLALLAMFVLSLSGCMQASLAQGLEDVAPAAVSDGSVQLRSVEQKPSQLRRVQPASKQQDSKDVASSQAATENEEPPALWLDMSMGGKLLDWFNENATSQDIARVDHFSQIDLLENVHVGRRLVVFKNVADAEQLLPRLADKMDIVGYNLEHGPANRPDEQADPVGSVRRMRALADEYGLELALGPDRAFALNDGVAMAPYVDMFVLQIQRAQTEPDVVREFVVPLVAQLRAANPELEISVQVRTEGDPVEIADLVKSMEDSLDGVSILTSEESTEIAEALVAELRPATPVTSAPALPTPSPQSRPTSRPAQAVALPTATSAPRRTSAATAMPASAATPADASQESDTQGRWMFAGGLAALGIVAASLLATLVLYAFQSTRTR